MRRKQIVIAQRAPVDKNPELNKQIEGLARGYAGARKTLLKLSARALLQLTIPNDPEHLKILEEVLEKLDQTANELEKKLEAQNLFHNEFHLTKLKLYILRARFLFSIDQPTKATEWCHQTILQLNKLLPLPDFHYAHDILLQQEIAFAGNSLRKFMYAGGENNHYAIFQYNLLGLRFAQKCPAGIAKLKLYFQFWTTMDKEGHFFIKRMKGAEKIEFVNVYNKTIALQEERLAADPDNMEAATQHAEANLLMFTFKTTTHPRSIWQQLNTPIPEPAIYAETELSLDEIKKYIVCTDETFKNHIDPSLAYLLAANPLRLLENGELVNDLISVMESFIKMLEAHILLYQQWAQQFPSLNQELDERILSIMEKLLDIREISLCYSPLDSDEIAPDAMRGAISTYRNQLIIEEKAAFERHSAAAEKAENFLLSWDEEEKKRMGALKKQLIKKSHSASSTSTPLTAKKELPSSLQHYFSRAQYFSRNLRTPEAHSMYEQAYTVAKESNDSLAQLAALDGRLFLTGKTLAKKAKALRDTFVMRLEQRKTMSKEKQNGLMSLIRDVTAEMSELTKLHTLYNSLSRQPALVNDDTMKEGITTSRGLIADLVEQINTEINESRHLFQVLCEQLERRRKNFILRLGQGDHIAGLQRFREIGKEKRHQGLEVSDFTYEKNNIESLTPYFETVYNHSEKLATYYQSPQVPKVLLSEPLRKALSAAAEVKGDFYLVGSNTTLLLSQNDDQARFNPHDIDLVGFQVDEQMLIAKGFYHPIYQPWLYQKEGVDITLSQSTSLLEDAKTRDFTICAVYIDKNGHAHDPLGTGIDDLANKRLRMIGDPANRLHKDPARALRAIRYIIAGYHPDENLVNALKTFASPQENQLDHLKAVAHKHLLHLDRKQYVKLLHQYNLLEKIFGIKCKTNIDLALWKLEYRLGIQKPTKTKHTYFFAHTDEHYAGLSREVAANPRLGDYASDMKEVAPARRLAMQALNL